MYSIFQYKEFALEYLTIGSGPKTILYFHGYGKSAEEYHDYELKHMGKFTVFSFNFFHHGNSVYPNTKIHSNTLSRIEFKEIMQAFITEKKINSFGLIGYSMGGKICLNILLAFPEKIDFLILNAPDGVKRNFWYQFTSKNKLGNALYKKLIDQPKFFFGFVKFLKSTRIIDKKLANFTKERLDTREKRVHVYNVWMTIRELEPNKKLLIDTIKKYKIKTLLNYGKFDRVITPKYGKRFHNTIKPHSYLNLMDKGHNLPYGETGKKISEFLAGINLDTD